MSTILIRLAKIAAVLGVAILIGAGVTLAFAMLGHEVLVLRYGDDLAAIDDTPEMFVAVAASYLAGIAAGLVAIVLGWRRAMGGRSRELRER